MISKGSSSGTISSKEALKEVQLGRENQHGRSESLTGNRFTSSPTSFGSRKREKHIGILVSPSETYDVRHKPKSLVRRSSRGQRDDHASENAVTPLSIQYVSGKKAINIPLYLRDHGETQSGFRWWHYMSKIYTIWAPNFILKRYLSRDPTVIQAWREKVTLCLIFASIGAFLVYLTLGITKTICTGVDRNVYLAKDLESIRNTKGTKAWIVRGEIYNMSLYLDSHLQYSSFSNLDVMEKQSFLDLSGIDATAMFPDKAIQACRSIPTDSLRFDCQIPVIPKISYCHKDESLKNPSAKSLMGVVRYPWEAILNSNDLLVYSGKVLNVSSYLTATTKFFGEEIHRDIINGIGRDISFRMSRSEFTRLGADCISAIYTIGFIDQDSPGCIVSQIVLVVSLMVILGVVLSRFLLATMFHWFVSWKLGKLQLSREEHEAAYNRLKRLRKRAPSLIKKAVEISNPKLIQPSNRSSAATILFTEDPSSCKYFHPVVVEPDGVPIPEELRQYYTVILVTCYSEGEDSLRKTLDSIAASTYSDEHKLIFVVADGLITGQGNSKSTPEIVLEMMEEQPLGPCEPQSYVAVADGAKRHNMARVHVGHYCCEATDKSHAGHETHHRVPMVLVIKCGTIEEQDKPKPGNRGKRDGQIILMDFFSKILFEDLLSPLQYELFRKIFLLTGVNPGQYEACLMVDADTKVAPDALSRLVAALAQDTRIMGACGETSVDNCNESWVTRIQGTFFMILL
jgi:chitin synthase